MKGDFDITAVYEEGLVEAVGFHKDALGPILASTFTWVKMVSFLLYSNRFQGIPLSYQKPQKFD